MRLNDVKFAMHQPHIADRLPSPGSSVKIILSLAPIQFYAQRRCSRVLQLAPHVMSVVRAKSKARR